MHTKHAPVFVPSPDASVVKKNTDSTDSLTTPFNHI